MVFYAVRNCLNFGILINQRSPRQTIEKFYRAVLWSVKNHSVFIVTILLYLLQFSRYIGKYGSTNVFTPKDQEIVEKNSIEVSYEPAKLKKYRNFTEVPLLAISVIVYILSLTIFTLYLLYTPFEFSFFHCFYSVFLVHSSLAKFECLLQICQGIKSQEDKVSLIY